MIFRNVLAAAALVAAVCVSGAARASGDPARGEAVVAARGCAACHGEQGVSAMPGIPSLAGMPAEFTVLQMILFREGLRDVPPMVEFARGLTDAEIEDIGAHLAALPATPPPDLTPREPAKAEAGAALSAAMRCGACHLPDYRGRAQMPRLAAQREDYLAHALAQYRDNQRVGTDTQMNGIMYGVSDANIAALAHYLAQLR